MHPSTALTNRYPRGWGHQEQRRYVAFVLTVTEHETERIFGEARYAEFGDAETAEFAIAVADAFHGLGLAERLVAALIDAARANGLRWLVGEVRAGHRACLPSRAAAAFLRPRAASNQG